jgi:hypothetical protein
VPSFEADQHSDCYLAADQDFYYSQEHLTRISTAQLKTGALMDDRCMMELPVEDGDGANASPSSLPHKPLALTAAGASRKNQEIQLQTIVALFRLGVPTERPFIRGENLKSLYLNVL